MSRNRRRAVAVATVGIFAVVPMVSACAAGKHPQSTLPTRLAEGVNASVHLVDIRNAFLLGPAPGQQLAAGESVPLYAWFVNREATPDRLVAVEAPGVAQSVEIAGGAIDLPPGRLVETKRNDAPSPTPAPVARTPVRAPAPKTPMALPTLPASGSAVTLKGLAKALAGGENVRLTLHFQQAGVVTLDIPVTPRDGYYSTYSPAPAPTTPTPTAPATPAAKSKKKTKTSATPTT